MIRRSEGERGVAILMVLFALLLLTGIALGLMYLTDTETGINSNFRSEQEAYYVARAGLEEARDRLRFGVTINGNNASLPVAANGGGGNLMTIPPTANNANGVIYITNPAAGEVVQPWNKNNAYFDDELCHENFPTMNLGAAPASGVPCTVAPGGVYYTQFDSIDPNTGTNQAMNYKWVRITIKTNDSAQYCPDGACLPANAGRPVCAVTNGNAATGFYPPYNEAPLPAGFNICENNNFRTVYLITSLGISRTGSRKMTQAETAQITLPPIPAAITFDGSAPNWNPPNSNAFTVNGTDAKTCGPGGPNMPALGAYDPAANTTLTTDASKRAANYTGACATNPCVQTVYNQLGTLSTVGGLENLATTVTSIADQTFTAPAAPSTLGTTTNPLITVVNGDYDMGNTSGSGVLLVTGNLNISGTPSFNGIILLIGKGSLTYKGSGTGVINGEMFVANIYDNSNKLLPPGSAPGAPSFTWSGAGNLTLNYDSCWVNKMANHGAYKVFASREELY